MLAVEFTEHVAATSLGFGAVGALLMYVFSGTHGAERPLHNLTRAIHSGGLRVIADVVVVLTLGASVSAFLFEAQNARSALLSGMAAISLLNSFIRPDTLKRSPPKRSRSTRR